MTEQSKFSVDILTHPDDIQVARRLQAQCYLRRQYVNEVEADGMIDDPWVCSATYFGARTSAGRMIGVSRLIPQRHNSLLPLHQDFELESSFGSWISAPIPGGLFEVSALAVAPNCGFVGGRRVLDGLIGAMSSYSIKRGTRYWVAAVDAKVFHHLRRIHRANLTKMGASRMYMGSMTVPVQLDLVDQFQAYQRCDPGKNAYFLRDSDLLELDLTSERAVLRPSPAMALALAPGSGAEVTSSVGAPTFNS